ncbi:helix-turn-helix domain-containing protein [Oscillospiraceae bacterium LTW-04]|nr:XRE family transcriptional regulator [Oscillospiraceae bacterium MB24-C1]
MEVNKIIAENLRRLRTDRNLSFGALSSQCGVSKVMLSQIEKGDTNPTINTIWKIANGLKVPYTALLEQQSDTTEVLKKADLAVLHGADTHYRVFCYYANAPDRNFELFQLEMDPGHSYDSIGHSEKAQEFIMVFAGCLALTVNGCTHTLHPDDAISFVASGAHTYTACGSEVLKAAIINFYPT